MPEHSRNKLNIVALPFLTNRLNSYKRMLSAILSVDISVFDEFGERFTVSL